MEQPCSHYHSPCLQEFMGSEWSFQPAEYFLACECKQLQLFQAQPWLLPVSKQENSFYTETELAKQEI